jgi:cellulose synthase/poly-beta-1,6-N-acetylglucosamine synthase-like glycosyltransferase
MRDFFRQMMTNIGVAGEVLVYLWQRRRWWLIPMVTVLLLVGLLLILASTSGMSFFIYTLF